MKNTLTPAQMYVAGTWTVQLYIDAEHNPLRAVVTGHPLAPDVGDVVPMDSTYDRYPYPCAFVKSVAVFEYVDDAVAFIEKTYPEAREVEFSGWNFPRTKATAA